MEFIGELIVTIILTSFVIALSFCSLHYGFGDLTDAKVVCAQHQLNYVNKTDLFDRFVICSDNNGNYSTYKLN